MIRYKFLLLGFSLAWLQVAGLPSATCLAVDSALPGQAQPVPGFDGWYRHQEKLWLTIADGQEPVIRMPAIAATLKSAQWITGEVYQADSGQAQPQSAFAESKQFKPNLKIEVDHWQFKPPKTKRRPESSALIQFTFESPVLLPDELTSTEASADGSYYLPAFRAIAAGPTLRYEPQPHKNTLGYWTSLQDYAKWIIHVLQPGKYNLAVLQGCGSGQGGSRAALLIQEVASPKPSIAQEFDVLETGHFQNFQWVQLQEVHLAEAGEFEIVIKPVKIANAALMDIRAVHLIRLPD